jgi:uncharacterized membrane protein YphA (DoxX/SURF4 family)
MEKIIAQGRCIFAFAIVAFGVQNIVCAQFQGAVIPVMPWVPAHPALAYLTGTILIAAGVCIAFNFRSRLISILLGVFFLVCTVALQVPKAAAHPFDLGIRTLVFETLSMSAGALVLARTLQGDSGDSSQSAALTDKFLLSGRYLFALSSIVFGISHFLLLRFIASLIPPWFPGGLFWAFFTGAAFVAAGVSIAAKIMDRLAAILLGAMFLIWFLFLHTPRLLNAAHSHNPNEWSSAFIALGMCGASWIVAQASFRERRT